MLLQPITDTILTAWVKPRPLRNLHTALFLIQGWSLVVLRQPLLEGDFVTAGDGVDHPAISQRFAALTEVSRDQALLDIKPFVRGDLAGRLLEFLSVYGVRYGSLTGQTELLLGGTPWLPAPCGRVISQAEMREGFTGLLSTLRPLAAARGRDLDALIAKDPWMGLFYAAAEQMHVAGEARDARDAAGAGRPGRG